MTPFVRTLRAAMRDFRDNGFQSRDQLEGWLVKLRGATESKVGSMGDYYQNVSNHMRNAYDLQVNGGKALKRHPGVARFNLNYIEPDLRAELDRRILAASELIKLNRLQAIDKTLQRFSGWATAIPAATGDVLYSPGKAGVLSSSADIMKSAIQMDYEARRVMIDQTHKLIANVDNIIAVSNGALAAVWHSHWKQPGYNYRDPHKDRDEHTYIIRGNWALEKGLMKPGASGYLDEITQPGEEVFCRCYVTYIYNLRSLPEEMLTKKGAAFLQQKKS